MRRLYGMVLGDNEKDDADDDDDDDDEDDKDDDEKDDDDDNNDNNDDDDGDDDDDDDDDDEYKCWHNYRHRREVYYVLDMIGILFLWTALSKSPIHTLALQSQKVWVVLVLVLNSC